MNYSTAPIGMRVSSEENRMVFFKEGTGEGIKKISTWTMVVLLILPFHSLISHAADEFDTAKDEAGTFQGQIIEIVENVLVIETSDGNVMQVALPGETGKRAAAFRVEELVEITMTPEGVTTSIIPVLGEVEP